MIKNKITETNQPSQAEFFIPAKLFHGQYQNALYSESFSAILSPTEKRVLIILARYAFLDGDCYPKQKTIAWKLGKTVRTIQRVLKSLVDKKFIRIQKPGLIDRHLFRKADRYFFVWHDAYRPFIDGLKQQMSPENEKDTNSIILNKQPPDAQAGIKNEQRKRVDSICREIAQHRSGFNARAFAGKYRKLYPESAIEAVLLSLAAKMRQMKNTLQGVKWWGYAVRIMQRVGPNHNEAESIREAEKEKAAAIPDLVAGLLAGIG